MAVTYCCRRVAAASGDARRALEVGRAAVDTALSELRASGGGERPAAEGGPLVTFKQMSLALSSTFKSATLALLESLPQHQQMILCAQVLRLRAATTAAADADAAADAAGAGSAAPPAAQACTLGALHASYAKLCADQRVHALDRSEMLPLCHTLAACGVFGLGNASGGGRADALSAPVWLCVSEDDMKAATKELRFFRNILGE